MNECLDDIGSVMDVWRRAENWFEPIGLKLSIQCLQEAGQRRKRKKKRRSFLFLFLV